MYFMNFVVNLRKLLTGLWLGAAIFFSAAVAQSAFAVLPSAELAGAVVNRTLALVNYSGIGIGLILLLSSFIFAPKGFLVWIERLLALILMAACAFGQFFVGWKLQSLREQIGRPIEELAADDAMRIAFNQLHQYSVWTLVSAMAAALLLFFTIVQKSNVVVEKPKDDIFGKI